MTNPTFEAVETLARALFEAAGDYECTWDEARDSIGQGIFFDVARAILTGSVTLPGLVPAAQVAEAVKAEREACARLARNELNNPTVRHLSEAYQLGWDHACDAAAAAIRERGEA